MSSDQNSQKIEDLPANESTAVPDADNVKGGASASFDPLQGVKAAPNGDADYLPYGKIDLIPGLTRR